MTMKKRSESARPFEFKSWRDLSPMNASVGNMLHNLTGSWRFLRPVFEDKTPPCQNACPAGNDIEGWIKLIGRGEYRSAHQHLRREQPFPAILGRVCFKFCQGQCNRAAFDEAVNINELERFVGDYGLREPYAEDQAEPNGRTLAVIGAGPAGLSAACFARRLGFGVTVFEARPEPGGVLRYGIPSYRLPKDIVAAECGALERMGVEFRLGTGIGRDVSLEELRRDYDFVFAATGAEKSGDPGLGGPGTARVVRALSMLRDLAAGRAVDLGQRVVVVGGGNTAIDAARTALRLGAAVTVVYRRAEEDMPAHADEIVAAREEGVEFCFQAAPERLEDGDSCGLVCSEMEPGEPDESGRPRPVRKKDACFTLGADTVLTAIGESPEAGYLQPFLEAEGGSVAAGSDLLVLPGDNGLAPVYAGGDLVDQPRTVVHAVAAGKRAVLAMDSRRRGLDWEQVEGKITIGRGPALSFSEYLRLSPVNPLRPNLKKVVTPEEIVFDYFERVPAEAPEEIPAVDRGRSFDPYHQTFSEEEAVREASRCLHCGRCMECDNCLVFCPEMSVLVKGEGKFGYSIDYDYCKGCGICAVECPRRAITLMEEQASAKAEE